MDYEKMNGGTVLHGRQGSGKFEEWILLGEMEKVGGRGWRVDILRGQPLSSEASWQSAVPSQCWSARIQ